MWGMLRSPLSKCVIAAGPLHRFYRVVQNNQCLVFLILVVSQSTQLSKGWRKEELVLCSKLKNKAFLHCLIIIQITWEFFPKERAHYKLLKMDLKLERNWFNLFLWSMIMHVLICYSNQVPTMVKKVVYILFGETALTCQLNSFLHGPI